MRRISGFLTLCVAGLAACGSQPAAGPSGQEVRELRITASDFSFDLPEEVGDGQVKLFLENEGKYPHQALLYRLHEGVDFEDIKSQLPEDESVIPRFTDVAGGVRLVIDGGESVSSAPQDLEPGTYVVVCFAHIGSEPKNHAEVGMLSELSVR